MRYRALTATGDYQFGKSRLDFLVDSPEAVAQAVRTRLLLLRGEWFLDVTEGTPYSTAVLGTGTRDTFDVAIRDRILGTQGVTAIAAYQSAVLDRKLSINATIDTQFGQADIQVSL